MIRRRGFLGTAIGIVGGLAFGKVSADPLTRDYHIWCDGDYGDDENSGSSPRSPVQSLQTAFERLPRIGRNMTIHLRGKFGSLCFPNPHKKSASCLILDGSTEAWERK